MLKPRLFMIALALTGCVSHEVVNAPPPPNPVSVAAAPITKGTGETIEAHLIERYNDTRANCGTNSLPAFLCNGVLIRGTSWSTAFHSWDPSPSSIASGGVSFSYLRRDAKYARLAYGYQNGLIFLPVFYANGKLTPEVLCAFPIDAGTNNRANRGCGAIPGNTAGGPCQGQGITTAQAWYNHYVSYGSSHTSQCGFDVRDAIDAAAGPAFDATIKAMALLGAASFNEQNEIRMAVWQSGIGSRLPLEAFFYINSSATGRSNARNDQTDFKNTTGLAVPVISVWLPRTAAEQASFKYLASDQAITLP